MGGFVEVSTRLLEHMGIETLKRFLEHYLHEHPIIFQVFTVLVVAFLVGWCIYGLLPFLNPRSRPEAFNSLRVKARIRRYNAVRSVKETLSWRGLKHAAVTYRIELVLVAVSIAAIAFSLFIQSETFFLASFLALMVVLGAFSVHREKVQKRSRDAEASPGTVYTDDEGTKEAGHASPPGVDSR